MTVRVKEGTLALIDLLSRQSALGEDAKPSATTPHKHDDKR
jgi:hypothetical protein